MPFLAIGHRSKRSKGRQNSSYNRKLGVANRDIVCFSTHACGQGYINSVDKQVMIGIDHGCMGYCMWILTQQLYGDTPMMTHIGMHKSHMEY